MAIPFCGDIGHISDTEKLPKDYNIGGGGGGGGLSKIKTFK